MFSKTEEKKSVAEMVNSSNVIAKETSIKGDIVTIGNIRIEGKVDGTLSSKTKIVIGESALLIGNIDTKEAEIAGRVEGEVRCSEVLFLKKTAVIEGNIHAKKLVIENGAVFNGQCRMTDHVEEKNESKTIRHQDEKATSEKRKEIIAH